jgi:hypothetical protein
MIHRPLAHALAALTCATALAACSDSSTGTKTAADCSAANLVTLAPLEAVILPAASANCLDLEPGTGSYIIVPQFATTAPDENLNAYLIGSAPPAAQSVAGAQVMPTSRPSFASASLPRRPDRLRSEFDHRRRVADRKLAQLVAGDPAARRAISAALVAAPGGSPPPLGSSRVFQMCGSLTCGTLKPDTAILKFIGANILLYQSQDAAGPPGGFTDPEITAFGNVFDGTLYGIDVAAFGPPTDIDGNGRVIVLLSPKVNALSPSNTCATSGYVAGYFYGADLIPTLAGSNQGEIYYSIVPDPAGTFSCAHTKGDVETGNGATFLHELLHMINFGEKVLTHGLNTNEEEFLDEGMAKIAEELGSLYYENKYPITCGCQRTDPSQLFPDSAEGFISGDLYNSYLYLLSPNSETATVTIDNGSDLAGAGGEWLLLRWLGDQKGQAIYTQIVQSALVGIPNLEAQSGEPFPSLFGEAALAFYTDSLVGIARDQVPAQYHYTSRNLRQLFQREFSASGGPNSDFPFPFPIRLNTVAPGASMQAGMLKGTMDFYVLRTPSSGPAERLRFTMTDGSAFPTTLNAQVSVMRCPAAGSACH